MKLNEEVLEFYPLADSTELASKLAEFFHERTGIPLRDENNNLLSYYIGQALNGDLNETLRLFGKLLPGWDWLLRNDPHGAFGNVMNRERSGTGFIRYEGESRERLELRLAAEGVFPSNAISPSLALLSSMVRAVDYHSYAE